MTALLFAIDKENLDVIKLLLANEKIDPNILYILIFLLSIQSNLKFSHSMELYIKLFNDVQYTNRYPALYLAIEKENIEIIKLLLANEKIDPNVPYILIKCYIYNWQF